MNETGRNPADIQSVARLPIVKIETKHCKITDGK
jgi:hypothetical protein